MDPHYSTLAAIAAALGMSVAELTGETGAAASLGVGERVPLDELKAKEAEQKLRSLDPEEAFTVALTVIPKEVWLPDERHTSTTLAAGKRWLKANRLTVEEVRRAFAHMDPEEARLIFGAEEESARKSGLLTYWSLMYEAARAGEISGENVQEKVLAFEGAL